MKKIVKVASLIAIIIGVIGIIKIAFFRPSQENGNKANMGLVVESNGIVYYNKYEKGIFAYQNEK